MNKYAVYKIVLPADCRIPTVRDTESKTTQTQQKWLELFDTKYINPKTDEEHHAWFHWCNGHHHTFLYWQIESYACEQVTNYLGERNVEQAVFWLKRAAKLVRGTTAVMINCGEFNPHIYDGFIRPAMKALREDFSADSSVDFLTQFKTKLKMLNAIKDFTPNEQKDGMLLKKAEDDFHDAEKYWMHKHIEITHKLHPGDSLLQEKLKHMADQGVHVHYNTYLINVVESREAEADYDHFFGVERTTDMTFESYWSQALNKLYLAHQDLHTTQEITHGIMQGDSLLMTIISEQLSE